MLIKELLSILNGVAPFALAESYDNVGLIVGSGTSEVNKIVLALDLTEDILKDAVENGADTIITHHPLIFDAVKSINYDTVQGRIISELIKNDISYIAMHTNLDKSKGGMNDYLAQLLGLKNVSLLDDETRGYCISVYVPKENTEQVKNAMISQGAGEIGEYSGCFFESCGTGGYVPSESAKPYIGVPGKSELTEETRLEMYCPPYAKDCVIDAMLKAHPYEQPLYYAVESAYFGEYGFGKTGELKKEMTLKEFCAFVKEKLDLPVLDYIGGDDMRIKTVGVCSGAGGDLYEKAAAIGLNAFITGDIKHNVAVLASQSKTALINAGHYGTEVIFKNVLGKHLQKRFDELQCNVNILYSCLEKSPWKRL